MTEPGRADEGVEPNGDQPADGGAEGDPALEHSRAKQALGVIAVFVGVQLPVLVAWLMSGELSPLSHVLAAAIAGVLVLLIDRMSRAGATVQAAEQVDARIDAAIQRAEIRIRTEAELSAQLRASAAATVARRSRDLLDHEFEIIDRLEADEEDGQRLSDLFHLDHLATRMNRNVASMLVLAGGWPTRVVEGRPLVSEILRAGVGEVQDYARVDVAVAVDPDVDGSVVGPLIHMVAELLDWVLHHHDGPVALRGAAGPAGTYHVRIVTPAALGRPAQDEVAQAFSAPGVDVPQRGEQLGLHLVSRLAIGLGASVGITAEDGGGSAVTIDLPAATLEQGVTPAQRRDRVAATAPAPIPSPVPEHAVAGDGDPAPGEPTAAPLPMPESPPLPSLPARNLGPASHVPRATPAPSPPASVSIPADVAVTEDAPAQPAAAAGPPAASGWSYSGYVDGTSPQGSGKWALGRGLRRKGKGTTVSAPQRAVGTAADRSDPSGLPQEYDGGTS